MASYNAWNGTPMAINPILKSIVEDQWGVDVLSSDGGAVGLLVTDHKRFATHEEAVVACLKAGINQFLDKYADETKAALKDGSITEREIDQLLGRKLRVAVKLGLLDPPSMVPYSTIQESKGGDSSEPWNTDKDRAGLAEARAGIGGPPEELQFVSAAQEGCNQIDRGDWAAGRLGALGLVWRERRLTPLRRCRGSRTRPAPNVKVNYAADEIGNTAIKAAQSSEVAVVVVGNDPTLRAGYGARLAYNTPTAEALCLARQRATDARGATARSSRSRRNSWSSRSMR